MGRPLRPVKRTALRGGTGGSLAHGPEGDGPARIRGVRLVRIPRATSPPAMPPRSELDRRRPRAPAIVTRRADRRGPGRAWGKGRGVARDETRPGLLNQQGQGRDVPGAGRVPRPEPQKRGAMPTGQGRGIMVFSRRSELAHEPPVNEIAERSRSSRVGMDPTGHMQDIDGCRVGPVLFENNPPNSTASLASTTSRKSPTPACRTTKSFCRDSAHDDRRIVLSSIHRRTSVSEATPLSTRMSSRPPRFLGSYMIFKAEASGQGRPTAGGIGRYRLPLSRG